MTQVPPDQTAANATRLGSSADAANARWAQEIATLRAQISILERTHDPSIVPNRTGNIIGLITLMVVLLGLGGGSSLYLQLNQIDRVDAKLQKLDETLAKEVDSGRDRIEDFRKEFRDEINHNFEVNQSSYRNDAEKSQAEFERLAAELRDRYAKSEVDRSVSLQFEDPMYRLRYEENGLCNMVVVVNIINNTPYLTQIAQTKFYYKMPLMIGSGFPFQEWNDIGTNVPPPNGFLSILVGNDVLQNFLSVDVGQSNMADLVSGWSPDKTFPFKFTLTYIKRGQETADITLERPVRVAREVVECARRQVTASPPYGPPQNSSPQNAVPVPR